jgi:ribosome-binding factor A
MTRPERFAHLLKEEISDIIRTEVSDPRIGFISVTDVSVSPDLKNAKIYVSIMGTEKQKKDAMQGLNSASGFIRRQLAGMLEVRSIPEISFVRDDSLERGSRVLGLLTRLENEKKGICRPKKSVKKR